MDMLHTPQQINMFRLATLRAAVRLEVRGLRTNRGRPATVIARELLGLPKSTKKADVLAALNAVLA